jgi:hypothetical protein
MELETIMLSKINQTQKMSMILLTCDLDLKKIET